jgi:imidazole glycerol-phosphate synthase subunit HisH
MLALIDYGAGNLHSAAKALERAAAECGYKGEIRVTSEARDIAKATHIVLPGVGAFSECKRGLDAVSGMVQALEQAVLHEKKPFLGICVGMQLLATQGLEHGIHKGLGWIAGEVSRLNPQDPTFKIPHMGWNELSLLQQHPVLKGINTGDHAYFVHSYHYGKISPQNLIATADYAGAVTAIIGRENIIGTQFHPEKSQATGLKLLANFLNWQP